jgi:hypothetical protein
VQTLESFNEFLNTHVSDTKSIKQYNSDIKQYLQSNKITEKHFSLKQFFSWKNASPLPASVVTKKKPLSPYWLIFLGAILILLSVTTLTLPTLNNRSGSLQRQAFLTANFKKYGTSFRQVLGTTTIIDPSAPSTDHAKGPSPLLKRAWSIFSFLFTSPKLLDPTTE